MGRLMIGFPHRIRGLYPNLNTRGSYGAIAEGEWEPLAPQPAVEGGQVLLEMRTTRRPSTSFASSARPPLMMMG